MVKHIVMWKMKNREKSVTENADALELKKRLLALKDLVPSLRHIEIGLNDKSASPDNHEIVLVSDFDDMDGLKEYIIHPEHVKVGAFVREVTEARTCIDYQY